MKSTVIKFFLLKILLVTLFNEIDAWHKSNFSISSQLPKICGVNKKYADENPSEPLGSWPWMGLLVFELFRSNVILIHPQAAITSLYTIKHLPKVNLNGTLFVAFGEPGSAEFQNVSVTDIDFPGKNYNTLGDIALLKLEKSIIVNDVIQPICLWEQVDDYSQEIANHIVLISGSDIDNLYSLEKLMLHQTPAKIIVKEKCAELNKDNDKSYEINLERQMCYTYYKEPIVCPSTGSAVMIPRLSEDRKIIWYLRAAVTQRGYFCDRGPFQQAVDIGSLRKWIESHFKMTL